MKLGQPPEERYVSVLMRMRGVLKVKPLSPEEREKILGMELEREGVVVRGASCENLGVKEALKRPLALIALTDMEFDWGSKPAVILTSGGAVVGEQIRDEAKLEELRGKRGYFFLGRDFVVNTARLRQLRERRLKFTLLPQNFPEEGGEPSLKGAVWGSPSREVDRYFKESIGADIEDLKLGTIIVGVGEASKPRGDS